MEKETYTKEELKSFFEYCDKICAFQDCGENVDYLFETWKKRQNPCSCGKTYNLDYTQIYDETGTVIFGHADFCPHCDYAEIEDMRNLILQEVRETIEIYKDALPRKERERKILEKSFQDGE